MKNIKGLSLIVLLLVVSLYSCRLKEENDYARKSWEHKQRMLELEYLKEAYRIKSDIELEQTVRYIDSTCAEIN